jgi:hypothetical protein
LRDKLDWLVSQDDTTGKPRCQEQSAHPVNASGAPVLIRLIMLLLELIKRETNIKRKITVIKEMGKESKEVN